MKATVITIQSKYVDGVAIELSRTEQPMTLTQARVHIAKRYAVARRNHLAAVKPYTKTYAADGPLVQPCLKDIATKRPCHCFSAWDTSNKRQVMTVYIQKL